MREVAEHLQRAATDIELISLSWPVPDESPADIGIDLHVESSRQWVGIVVERLQVWSERANKIAAALDRSERRHPAGRPT